MGMCVEVKHKYHEPIKAIALNQGEEKQKPVNTENTYNNIKSIVMDNYSEKKVVKKTKDKNTKNKIEIGL
jgi:hypothetical protein